MPLSFALVISLLVHAALLAPPWWRPTPRQATTPPPLAVRLEAAADLSETLATKPALNEAPPPLPSAGPRPRPSVVKRNQAALTEHLFYPAAAASAGIEGETILLLLLDTGGAIESVEIARSSGHAILDQAALEAARKLGALPGNPRQLLLPVSFRLN